MRIPDFVDHKVKNKGVTRGELELSCFFEKEQTFELYFFMNEISQWFFLTENMFLVPDFKGEYPKINIILTLYLTNI